MQKLFYGLLCLMLPAMAGALNPSEFTINRVTAPYFIVDGNSPGTLTQAYVGFKIKNISGSNTWNNLSFTITSIGTSVVGQNYSVLSPSSGTINIGSLGPGQSRVVYFYVNYPASTSPQATFNLRLSDATASALNTTSVIYNRSSISANAGGSATQTFTNQDVIGGLVYDDVTYAVGNSQNNDEVDFQVAVSTAFDPTKLQLLSTSIQASSVPNVNVGTIDSLYFRTGNGSNGSTVTVRFIFRITGFNFTNYLLPSAGSTSGSTNYKYALNTNLGTGTPVVISSTANPLTISKTANKSFYFPNEVATFTITISNPSAYGVSIDKLTDHVPNGFSYSALDPSSQVTNSNSTSTPSASSTGNISFNAGVTNTNTSTYYVPAGGSLVLKYTAVAPNHSAFNLKDTAYAYVGITPIGNANTTVNVTATLPLTLMAFNGEWLNDRVWLKWKTSNEQNTLKTEIERSIGAGQYIKIGERQAAGFSATDQDYDFIDYAPSVSEVNKYRLKLIDQDGKFSYSAVLSVKGKISSSAIVSVYPNPFNAFLQLKLEVNRTQQSRWQLVNMKGQAVASGSVSLVKGSNSLLIPELGSLAHGLYSLQITTTEGTLGQLLIK